jgi:hypothetical protein
MSFSSILSGFRLLSLICFPLNPKVLSSRRPTVFWGFVRCDLGDQAVVSCSQRSKMVSTAWRRLPATEFSLAYRSESSLPSFSNSLAALSPFQRLRAKSARGRTLVPSLIFFQLCFSSSSSDSLCM